MALDFNAAIKDLPAHLQADENSVVMQTQIGAASLPPLLVLDNGQWQVKRAGQVISTYQGDQVNVIIHAIPPQNGRIMYSGRYVPGAPPTDPTCWSLDGNQPHESVPAGQKQANDCSLCPMNVKGSAGEGDFKKCSSTTQIIVSTIEAPDVLLRFNVNGTTAFGDGMPAENKFGFNQYIDFVRSQKVDVTRLVTALLIDRTPGANNKTLFAPMAVLEDTDAAYIAHKALAEGDTLDKALLPYYVSRPALPSPAEDPNLVAPAHLTAQQAQARPNESLGSLIANVPAPNPQPAQPVQPLQPLTPAQAVQPLQPAPAGLAPAPLQPMAAAPVVAGGDPTPGTDVAPGSLPAVPDLATEAVAALGQPAQAPVIDPATQPQAAPPVVANPASVTPAAVTPEVDAAVAGLSSMDLSDMMPTS